MKMDSANLFPRDCVRGTAIILIERVIYDGNVDVCYVYQTPNAEKRIARFNELMLINLTSLDVLRFADAIRKRGCLPYMALALPQQHPPNKPKHLG